MAGATFFPPSSGVSCSVSYWVLYDQPGVVATSVHIFRCSCLLFVVVAHYSTRRPRWVRGRISPTTVPGGASSCRKLPSPTRECKGVPYVWWCCVAVLLVRSWLERWCSPSWPGRRVAADTDEYCAVTGHISCSIDPLVVDPFLLLPVRQCGDSFGCTAYLTCETLERTDHTFILIIIYIAITITSIIISIIIAGSAIDHIKTRRESSYLYVLHLFWQTHKHELLPSQFSAFLVVNIPLVR